MKQVFLIFIYFSGIFAFSQVRTGSFNLTRYNVKKCSKPEMAKFKSSTTFFVIDEKLNIKANQLKSVLDDVWTITPYKIINEDEFENHLSENNSFARFRSLSVTSQGTMTTATSGFIAFDFMMPDKLKKTKKGKFKWNTLRFGAIYFTPDIVARQDVSSRKSKIYGDLLNYRIGYLKNSFQSINNMLFNQNYRDIYEYFVNKSELKKVKNKKLYLDEDFIYGYNPYKIKEKESFTNEELFQDYEFKYEIVSSEALNNKILDAKEDFYYLMYNQLNSNKILTIINGKTGEIILQEHKTMSFNLKPKDLKQLSKSIEKAK